jgi:hypothetical protein
MSTASESVSSEQDKTIASVVLAGWRLVRFDAGAAWAYRVYSPSGDFVGVRNTRYTAALLAETWLNEPRLQAFLPEPGNAGIIK